MTNRELYPAIDIRDGVVVRLRRGDYAQETRYDTDPLVLAQRYALAGARWLHLVDLDAARSGGYTLLPLLRRITATTALRVQTGGGVRSDSDVAAILDGGAERVVVGSLAVRQPETVVGWIDRFGPAAITVALDTRRDDRGQWRLPVAGWTRDGGAGLRPLLRRYAAGGLRHLLCTDIERDGMLAGPNIALYRDIMQQVPSLALQASGGVRDAVDIDAAYAAGCAGVVLGKALLDGRIDLGAALAEAAC